jgi:hypothetical protein
MHVNIDPCHFGEVVLPPTQRRDGCFVNVESRLRGRIEAQRTIQAQQANRHEGQPDESCAERNDDGENYDQAEALPVGLDEQFVGRDQRKEADDEHGHAECGCHALDEHQLGFRFYDLGHWLRSGFPVRATGGLYSIFVRDGERFLSRIHRPRPDGERCGTGRLLRAPHLLADS